MRLRAKPACFVRRRRQRRPEKKTKTCVKFASVKLEAGRSAGRYFYVPLRSAGILRFSRKKHFPSVWTCQRIPSRGNRHFSRHIKPDFELTFWESHAVTSQAGYGYPGLSAFPRLFPGQGMDPHSQHGPWACACRPAKRARAHAPAAAATVWQLIALANATTVRGPARPPNHGQAERHPADTVQRN